MQRVVPRRIFVTLLARQFDTQMFLSSFFGHYPRSQLKGWVVPDVLSMPTLEVSNPIELNILMKPDHALKHQLFPSQHL